MLKLGNSGLLGNEGILDEIIEEDEADLNFKNDVLDNPMLKNQRLSPVNASDLSFGSVPRTSELDDSNLDIDPSGNMDDDMMNMMADHDHNRTESFISNTSDMIFSKRVIRVNVENTERRRACKYLCYMNKKMYKNNYITTSKYNLITFLPKNLLL